MAFDITTAKPINVGKFDITTAKPIEDKFSGQPKPSFYSEVVSPVLSGASTFAAGVPKMIAKEEAARNRVPEVVFPEQQTVPGKILRGASELTGFSAGLPGRAAVFTGKAISKGIGQLPKFAGKEIANKMVAGAGAGAAGGGLAGSDIGNRKTSAEMGALLGGGVPLGVAGGKFGKDIITKSGRWVAKNIGGITDSTVATIKKLGANRVFDPAKAQVDYISQNLAPRLYRKLVDFKTSAKNAYNQAMNAAPEGKQINIRPAIEQAGSQLKELGLVTKSGNLTELGQSEIARDSVYGKLLDFYKSADALSGVKKLQGKELTQGQMIKAMKAERETLVNKKQYTFLRDKLNALYKNKPSDVDVGKVVNQFYLDGEASGIKGLQQARELFGKLFEIEDKIDVNKITREMVKAKNPQWTKVIKKEYEDLVTKGILDKNEYNNIMDDLEAHFANQDFGLVSETPGAGGGIYPSKSGLLRGAVAGGTKQYYKKVAPKVEAVGKFTGQAVNAGKDAFLNLHK